ncbi:MAG TPA: C-terminal helicase domain-containing protein, partial [Gemmatimonadaceae bacterium]|nr:C-terminal helicase domain-containing protein [Gemmatimonadaceae bacterium]
KRIAAAGWGHVLFHGGVDSRARAKLIDRFRDDPECRVFLSTDAGGVGLNLQHASVVINVDLPWNPAVLEQRIGRVHRIGQRVPVRVVNFVAEGTIEQGMLSVLRFKKSLFAGVLDGGETEVFLGKGRLDRFMESIEKVTAEIQPVPVAAETPADTGVAQAGATALAEPLARLLESGVGFLRQLEAALPAEADQGGNGGRSVMRKIEARQNADGSAFLAVPMPSRDAVARFTDGLAALLRSVLP